MTTKEESFVSKKQLSEIYQTHIDKSFFNLNLNPSHKYSNDDEKSIQSFSKSSNDTKSLSRYTVSDNHQGKEKASNKSFSKDLSLKSSTSKFESKEKENPWKNDKNISNNKNSSTLSLHIAAYENSVKVLNEFEDSPKKSKTFKTFKSFDSLSKLNQDLFEFPRQMNGIEQAKPQIMQFKTSQKLFSPNQGASTSQMQPLSIRMSEPTTSSAKRDGGRYFLFDATKKKIKPGPKRTAPQNIIKRAGGLSTASLKYSDYIPLYELWCGYFSELLSTMKHPDERLLKTDYHGCILFVTDSPNPSQLGLHGIVLHESKSTFQLLTKKDKLIVIQKEHTTFQFVFQRRVFTLFGDALGQRSFARGKKFKGRLTLPFFLPASESSSPSKSVAATTTTESKA